jgi:16S rRNA (uracil1498-N3)-methyltransferase
MRMPRLFIEQALVAGTEITLHDAPAHYVRNVLRLERGNTLSVFDDSGSEFTAVLAAIERRSLRLALGNALAAATESPLSVHLGIGLARGERMDWTVQKSTELGVATITPLLLARCNAKLDAGRGDNRLRHWRQVAIAACEQSGTQAPAVDRATTAARGLVRCPCRHAGTGAAHHRQRRAGG